MSEQLTDHSMSDTQSHNRAIEEVASTNAQPEHSKKRKREKQPDITNVCAAKVGDELNQRIKASNSLISPVSKLTIG